MKGANLWRERKGTSRGLWEVAIEGFVLVVFRRSDILMTEMPSDETLAGALVEATASVAPKAFSTAASSRSALPPPFADDEAS